MKALEVLALAPVALANDADDVKVDTESPLPPHNDPKHSHACLSNESVEQKVPFIIW